MNRRLNFPDLITLTILGKDFKTAQYRGPAIQGAYGLGILNIGIVNSNLAQGMTYIYISTSTRVDPKVSLLAAWSENCKRYSSLPLGAVVSLFCESI
jgi:hypothetical protein